MKLKYWYGPPCKIFLLTALLLVSSCGVDTNSEMVAVNQSSSETSLDLDSSDYQVVKSRIPEGCRKKSLHHDPAVRRLMNLTFKEYEAVEMLRLKQLEEAAETGGEKEKYRMDAAFLAKKSLENYEEDCAGFGIFGGFDLGSVFSSILSLLGLGPKWVPYNGPVMCVRASDSGGECRF